jgi:hypothetical protein
MQAAVPTLPWSATDGMRNRPLIEDIDFERRRRKLKDPRTRSCVRIR